MGAEVAAMARRLAGALSDVVWSIDPGGDDLRNLIMRVRQLASQVLEAQGIAWKFRTPAEPEKVKTYPRATPSPLFDLPRRHY